MDIRIANFNNACIYATLQFCKLETLQFLCIIVIEFINNLYSLGYIVMTDSYSDNTKFSMLLEKHMKAINNISTHKLAEKMENYGVKISHVTINQWRKMTEEFQRPDCQKIGACADALELNKLQKRELLVAAGCEIEVQEKPVVPMLSTPVSSAPDFFGHYALLNELLQEWQTKPRYNVLIQGVKYSGKTSLLKQIWHIQQGDHLLGREKQRQLGTALAHYEVLYLDFRFIPKLRHVAGFLDELSGKLKIKLVTLDDVPDILEDELSKPLLLLLDNIEWGIESEGLPVAFWQTLRGLTSLDTQVCFCVASRQSPAELMALAQKVGRDSPFFNTFIRRELLPFTEEEAWELLACLSYTPPKAAKSYKLSAMDKQWMFQESRGWPVLLQEFCECRLQAWRVPETQGDWKACCKKLKQDERYMHLFA